MNQNAIEKILETLPLYTAIFSGKDGARATTHGRNGIISIPSSKERELECLAVEKAKSPDDPENGLAMAFKLHLKGGDVIQKGFRSYHYSRICWSLLMQEADRLRKTHALP